MMKTIRIHVTVGQDGPLQTQLEKAMKPHCQIVDKIAQAQVLLFVSTGLFGTALETWLDQTSLYRAVPRMLCLPAISARQRSLFQRRGAKVTFIKPAGNDVSQLAARILGELFVTLPYEPQVPYLIGRSQAILSLIQLMDRYAVSPDPVLIQGESGTGKELCARYLHQKRNVGELLAINSGAFNQELYESKLYGHVRGAFTGASQDSKGLFREAGKGTCFLDEIGDLDLSVQVGLLRVLEDQKVRPVGGSKEYKMEARLVLATNLDLQKKVDEGRFRTDLYHRIAVFRVQLPSLRERMEDLPLLVNHFIEAFNSEQGTNILPPSSYD